MNFTFLWGDWNIGNGRRGGNRNPRFRWANCTLNIIRKYRSKYFDNYDKLLTRFFCKADQTFLFNKNCRIQIKLIYLSLKSFSKAIGWCLFELRQTCFAASMVLFGEALAILVERKFWIPFSFFAIMENTLQQQLACSRKHTFLCRLLQTFDVTVKSVNRIRLKNLNSPFLQHDIQMCITKQIKCKIVCSTFER